MYDTIYIFPKFTRGIGEKTDKNKYIFSKTKI